MTKSDGSVEVIVRDLKLNPTCRHGPTILFSRDNRKFFSCSCLRTEECFRLDFASFNQNELESHHEFKHTAASKGLSLDEVKMLHSRHRVFCIKCKIFVESSSLDHESHDVSREVTDDQLQQPSLFLPQLDNDKLNAQYFFDINTLDFICSMLEELKLNKVICLGAPRLHDYIRERNRGTQSILLDIDNRFQAFNREGEFLHYNMFNNFFFGGPADEDKFRTFLKADKSLAQCQHIIFTDPPFAARTELLAYNLRTISSLYKQVNSNHEVLPIMWIFPYFNEHHIKKEMPEMEMLDFQITYMNHKAYRDGYKGRKAGSPVRLFTNIDPRILKFPERFTNYRFCKKCKRSVAVTNNHCEICQTCPSKNGATYKHCTECVMCVKPNYVHCSTCARCVLQTGHECKAFQNHQICWLCDQRGHVEKFCVQVKKLKKRKDGSCSLCKGSKIHNLRSCPTKLRLYKNKTGV
jgi:hypothetical protein